jgi:biopolymer transport protein ExbD
MAFGSGNFEGPSGGGVMSEINMTPLVDVMLVLLIIFMLTVPVITHSVKLDLPRAENAPNEIKPKTVNLAITEDGTLYWNEAVISKEDYAARLA